MTAHTLHFIQKKHIVLIGVVLMLLGGIIAGLLTLKQRQYLSPRAEAEGIGINFQNTVSSGENWKWEASVAFNNSCTQGGGGDANQCVVTSNVQVDLTNNKISGVKIYRDTTVSATGKVKLGYMDNGAKKHIFGPNPLPDTDGNTNEVIAASYNSEPGFFDTYQLPSGSSVTLVVESQPTSSTTTCGTKTYTCQNNSGTVSCTGNQQGGGGNAGGSCTTGSVTAQYGVFWCGNSSGTKGEGVHEADNRWVCVKGSDDFKQMLVEENRTINVVTGTVFTVQHPGITCGRVQIDLGSVQQGAGVYGGDTYDTGVSCETPAATNTPVPQATNTPVPGATNTPVPEATATPTPQATNTPIPTNTPTPIPTNTPTPVPPTLTPVPTEGRGSEPYTPTPTQTVLAQVTATHTPGIPRSGNTQSGIITGGVVLMILGIVGLLIL